MRPPIIAVAPRAPLLCCDTTPPQTPSQGGGSTELNPYSRSRTLSAALFAMQQVMEQVQLPKAVLLDVNGTLFPPSAAAPAFQELGLRTGDVQVGAAQLAGKLTVAASA